MNREVGAVLPAEARRVPVSQGALFQRLRWRLLRNSGTQLFGNSRIRIASMLLISVLIWGFIYALSWFGFHLLAVNRIFFAGSIVSVLFDVMFFTFGIMLVFSTGIILYASLFTAPETRFLLSTPARADQIFAAKFQGAVAFSSWAFVILGGPILIAYGVAYDVPWYFYALLPVLLVGYVVLPGSVGALLSLLIVNYLPQKRKQALVWIILFLVVLGGLWAYRVIVTVRQSVTHRDSLYDLFALFSLATSSFSPSHWMTQGLLAAARREPGAALFPLALVWSNALFLYLVAALAAGRLYRRGYNRLSTGGEARKRARASRLDRVMNFLVGYLDPKTRLLIVKDFRTFRREPAQVGQVVIFGGLLLLSVLNFRQFSGESLPVANLHALSLLNVSIAGLMMCIFLNRFVYPLISLEGRKFWILGLLPLRREQILWGKFAFALTCALIVSEGIVLLSDLLLGLPLLGVLIHVLTVAVLAVGLTGMSVGMSAWMPNFRETDPSKIAVGFGGTVNTIFSLLFLGLVIVLMAGPYHAASVVRGMSDEGSQGLPPWGYLAMLAGLGLCVVAVVVPMRAGARTLRRMEF